MDSLCCLAIGIFAIIAVIIFTGKSNFRQPLFYNPKNSILRVSYDPNLYPTDNMVNLASESVPTLAGI